MVSQTHSYTPFHHPYYQPISLLECLLCAIICPEPDSHSSHYSSARSGSRQHPNFIDKQLSPEAELKDCQAGTGSSHLGLQEHRCCLVLVHVLRMGPWGCGSQYCWKTFRKQGPGLFGFPVSFYCLFYSGKGTISYFSVAVLKS